MGSRTGIALAIGARRSPSQRRRIVALATAHLKRPRLGDA